MAPRESVQAASDVVYARNLHGGGLP